MDDHEKRYAVTVYVAAAGTPLMAGAIRLVWKGELLPILMSKEVP
ncbi:hypothetical protein FHT05_000135 [Xanthomonas arboricola]|nr:hypothetical protein [Xanthomonas arboricola]